MRGVRLLTNNPRKVDELEMYDLPVRERVPHEVAAQEENRSYLRTKRDRLGHLLHHVGLGAEPGVEARVKEPTLVP